MKQSNGNEAFMNCTSLQSVVLPNSAVSFGEKVFGGCKNIVTVAVPSNVLLNKAAAISSFLLESVSYFDAAEE